MHKLGEKLAKIGLVDPKKALLERVKADALAKQAGGVAGISLPPRAMDKLPKELDEPLKEVKEKDEFLEKLKNGLIEMRASPDGEKRFSIHTVIGLAQVVHWQAERTDISPSRRKGFKRIVWWFLEIKDRMQKKMPAKPLEYYFENLKKVR